MFISLATPALSCRESHDCRRRTDVTIPSKPQHPTFFYKNHIYTANSIIPSLTTNPLPLPSQR